MVTWLRGVGAIVLALASIVVALAIEALLSSAAQRLRPCVYDRPLGRQGAGRWGSEVTAFGGARPRRMHSLSAWLLP